MQSYPEQNAGNGDNNHAFYSPTSSQQAPGMSNPEDIQLSAQLSRSIAHPATAGHTGMMAGQQDHRDHGLVNHHYSPGHDMAAHSPHLHSPMDQIGVQYNGADGSGSPAKRRSKISRACDECRRKKIKCDATNEQPDEVCSNCRRVGTKCKFSRVPMKRGPSKGYIKELAERVNHLEAQVQNTGDLPHPQVGLAYESPIRRESDDLSPPPSDLESSQKKRPYSAISRAPEYGAYATASHHHWQQELHRQPPHQNSYSLPLTSPGGHRQFREPDYSPNGLQPSPQWNNIPAPIRQQSSSIETMEQNESRPEQFFETEKAILDRYFAVVHPTLPLLPQNKAKLLSMLSKCSPSLMEAFNESLIAALSSFPSHSHALPDQQQQAKKAAGLVIGCQLESHSTRPLAANLVQLQALILMSLQAGNHPSKGRSAGSVSTWLGGAVALAYELKLHIRKAPDRAAEGDLDSDDKLERRLWWIVVTLDRWHASSTASPLMVPDSSVLVYKEDKLILGESFYALSRLSIILGHFTEFNLAVIDPPAFAFLPVLGTTFRGELERWREDLPESIHDGQDAPIVRICFWYLSVLKEMLSSSSEPRDLLHPARKIVRELEKNPNLISPLTYHSTSLATLTLLELSTYENTKDDAANILRTLTESLIAPTGWDPTIRDFIASKHTTSSNSINESQQASVASQGLQRLADLATQEGNIDVAAGSENRHDTTEKGNTSISTSVPPFFQQYRELRDVIKNGYLNAFTGESGR